MNEQVRKQSTELVGIVLANVAVIGVTLAITKIANTIAERKLAKKEKEIKNESTRSVVYTWPAEEEA